MKKQITDSFSPSKPIFKNFVLLPTPTSINYIWNIGSILGMILVFQLLTGLFLSIHYSPTNAFDSVIHFSRDVKMGIETRLLHSNGASLFFILIYIHIARGMLNISFKKLEVWITGIAILLVLIITAFIGYVLPWGQISFWGATVITNLASAVPILGNILVQWLWGGFSVDIPTLNRFFSLHFLLPFILVGFSILHLISLHKVGSINPIGVNRNQEKTYFQPYFSIKDILSIVGVIFLIFLMTWKAPYMLMDPENFSPANPINTPIHIQPEWYFLFAYALLRSIPNKLGGVIALLIRIIILAYIPIKKTKIKNSKFNSLYKIKIIIFFITFSILTWLGAIPIEIPYIILRKIIGPIYFILIIS